jgi:alpha-beta hydrolase superfamily lysophospholipase
MLIHQSFTIKGAEGKPILMDLSFKTGQEENPMVIFVHGFKGFKDWGAYNLVAEYFVKQGFRFLKFNFSHNGTTPENPIEFADLGAFGGNTFSKEFTDLDLVISFVKSGIEFQAPSRLSLIGHSRGGGTCIIQAAKDQRVSKLVTWAAIADFRSLWKKEDEIEWQKKGVIFNFNSRTKQYTPLKIDLLHDLEKNFQSFDILQAAGRISKPWLILHGDQDENVLTGEAIKLKDSLLFAFFSCADTVPKHIKKAGATQKDFTKKRGSQLALPGKRLKIFISR